jgi:hypothetical protein
MTGKQAVNEHAKLVRILRTGSKKELSSEAKDQAGELKQYRKTARKPNRSVCRK